ncbi:MAG TPA: hypothetical protein VFA43_17395 [Gemmatimonadaceae bacterium]|nr:hypothetical protein [Gemmatimonadaceae bacterium]
MRGIDVLANGTIRDLMRSGFPARLHYHVELWTASGVFNTVEDSRDWDIIARYDPLTKHFRAARINPENAPDRVDMLGDFDRAQALDSTLAFPYAVPLLPRDHGRRYYYVVALDVDVVSLSDLDEVERWLRGELRPAVRGQRNPSGVVGRGIRTLFLRIIGAEKRHYEARTKIFRSG